MIKLADFSHNCKKHRSYTQVIATTKKTQQHTVYYTAPEFLNDVTRERSRSMDVYSSRMIGYEILTRKRVYHDSTVRHNILVDAICTRGQKPNKNNISEVDDSLPPSSVDSKIFKKLNEIVKKCWEFEPSDRPKIVDVKKKLDSLAESEKFSTKTWMQKFC